MSQEDGSVGEGRELATQNGARLRLLGLTYWLIAKHENGRMEVFTVDSDGDGGEALPVFSYEEEAEMFLRLGEFGDGWQVKKSASGELVSVLLGPCAGVGRVTLDPLPEVVAGIASNLLVSLYRGQFIEHLMDNGSLQFSMLDRGSPLVVTEAVRG
ncbi:MAG TPA: hypothetical protein VK361_01185 [Rubrobacteraceae bacterium]|nr:hypothetical protein [Rubrobacteraceae bacterium]